MKRLLALLVLASSAASLHAAEPKKVIVCTVTTGFRHSSIPFAEKTLQKLADESKAYTVVDWVQQPATKVPNAPSKPKEPKPDADEKAKAKYTDELAKYEGAQKAWEAGGKAEAAEAKKKFDEEMKTQMAKLAPANLAKVDAVIFANTTGDDFPLPDKPGFFQWIKNGGAFIGMHSATDTFKNFEPYYGMLQGTFDGHGAQVPADLIVADQQHAATTGLPAQWDLKEEEMYLIKNHDRSKLRTLLYLKHHPNKPETAGYFPVSWCRVHEKGRVFYTSLGHREDLWSDDPEMKGRKNPVETAKQYQQHILGGIKWALGLDKGSVEPGNVKE
jgi:uncharacterized protein